MSPKDTDAHAMLGNPNQLTEAETTAAPANTTTIAIPTNSRPIECTSSPRIHSECTTTMERLKASNTPNHNNNNTNNLIGEMINDVSKTINDSAAAATETGGTHNIAAGDFPTYMNAAAAAAAADTSSTLSTDASKPTNTTTDALTAAVPTQTATITTLATITTTTTAMGATTLTRTEGQLYESKLTPTNKTITTMRNCSEQETKPRPESIRTQTTATAVKSKSTENKCPSEEPTKVSNQREVEANTSTPQRRRTTTFDGTTSRNSNKWRSLNTRQCERLEYERNPTGLQLSTSISQDIATRILSLAERKAKLKSDFFENNKFGEAIQSSAPTEATELPREPIHKALPSSGTKVDWPKRLLRRNTSKLKLKIIKSSSPSPSRVDREESTRRVQPQVLPHVAVAVAEPTKLSLVEQRKLDLKRKFEQQTSTPTSNHTKSVLRSLPPKGFPRVEQLVEKFDSQRKSKKKMIVNPNKVTDPSKEVDLLSLKPEGMEQRNSPLSDEGCNLGHSPYSSDNEDNESIRTTSTTVERSKRKDKVARSASSDSALGLDVDDSMDAVPPAVPQQRRMTLTVTDLPLRPALLPLAEPTALPDSPTTDLQQNLQNLLAQTAVPTKVLLEERVVEIPDDPRCTLGGCSLSSSRRESAQSCLSDYPTSECGGVRFVRTPSVVVSDYSDDVMCGITLEEIEYFRAQRMRRRRSSLDTAGTEKDGDGHSDVSASSSCSNLYYCGSTISALDGSECFVNGTRQQLERKASDCSTCSVSGDEDGFTIPEQPEDPNQMGKDLADLLAAQHLSSKRAKKVGLVPVIVLGGEKTEL